MSLMKYQVFIFYLKVSIILCSIFLNCVNVINAILNEISEIWLNLLFLLMVRIKNLSTFDFIQKLIYNY